MRVIAFAWLALLLALCRPAKAIELPASYWVNLGGVTAHSGGDFNGVNPGLGLEGRWSSTWAAELGTAYNSERRWSRYAVVMFTPWRVSTPIGNVDAGILAGTADRYTLRHGQPIGVAAALAVLRGHSVTWYVMAIPKVPGMTEAASITLGLKVRLP